MLVCEALVKWNVPFRSEVDFGGGENVGVDFVADSPGRVVKVDLVRLWVFCLGRSC